MAIYTVGGKAPSKKVIESIKVKYFSPISGSSFDALSKQLSTHPSFRNFKEFRWKNQIQRIIPHEGLETIREEDNINASLSKNIDGDQIKDLIEHRAAWASNLAGFQEGFKLNSEAKNYISNVYDTLLKNHPNTDLKITRIMVGFKGKEKGAIVLVGRLGTKQQSIKDDKAVIISLHPG
ncbi:hypothetical protein H0N96_00025, partial [Candidatus Micrarchaeota archaeon]|nr:hypothetical protein [Candidatus Micrarchaeota archaeon]